MEHTYTPRPVDNERLDSLAAYLRSSMPEGAADVMGALDANPSAHLPYHGTPHILVVAHAVLELAADENLDHTQTLETVLAAVFHDVDYAGDPDDSVNIERAVAAAGSTLTRFMDPAPVARLIRATCFPHRGAAPGLQEAVLRDADVAYSSLLIPDAQHFRTGLFIERGAPATEQDALAFVLSHGVNTQSAADKINRFVAAAR